MSKRVPASTTRKRIEALMERRTVSADARNEFVKLAVRLLLEESGEAESRTAVSELTELLRSDYQAFAGRDLSAHRVL